MSAIKDLTTHQQQMLASLDVLVANQREANPTLTPERALDQIVAGWEQAGQLTDERRADATAVQAALAELRTRHGSPQGRMIPTDHARPSSVVDRVADALTALGCRIRIEAVDALHASPVNRNLSDAEIADVLDRFADQPATRWGRAVEDIPDAVSDAAHAEHTRRTR